MTFGAVLVALTVAFAGSSAISAERPEVAVDRKAVKRAGVVDFRFVPKGMRLRSGDAIRWIFPRRNSAPHNVTAFKTPRGVPRRVYSSKRTIGPGSAFARRFKRPGIYRFVCTIHPFMRMGVGVSR